MTDPDIPLCPNGHKSGFVDRETKSYCDGKVMAIHEHYRCDECDFEVVIDRFIHSEGGDGKRP